MNPEFLKAAAESNNWIAIMPELLLGCLALLLLVLEVVLPKNKHDLIPGVAIIGQLGVLVGLIINYRTPFLDPAEAALANFNGLLAYSPHGQFMRMFFLLTSLLVSALGTVALAKQKMPKIEFFHIVLVISAAMMLLAQSNHFVMLFVALETVTVGFYILVSYVRTNPLSLEAGLKYLIMGALSSSLLLFGIVLLYGAAGNPLLPGHTSDAMNFGKLTAFLAQNPDNFLAQLGVVLVLSGVAFKIGAVPFQIWVPDVYQGAPTPVTAFLAVGSKAAGFAILMTLVYVFAPYKGIVIPLLAIMAAATILFGNLAALTQHNVKRLIGLSGVSHAGYLLLGVIASITVPMATSAIYFYLVTYLLASFAVFGVMTHVAGVNDADQELEHYTDLVKTHPFLATILAAGLGSLAGIPPLAGFIGKLLVFIAAFQAGLTWLLGIAIIGVVISIYYYFGWIKAAFFATSPTAAETVARPERTPVSAGIGALLAVLALASVLFGFYQKPVIAWLTAAL
ncbi:NADH-quinone oxidoreductase subunit N [Nibricoccus aquaticus]|uniref:NADH-quinone oxidoreductase subunit N n=1 Tax=Nibricoccus aquaticus TaxID=2576891 RepID=A0A290QLL5_9BACT|nr:NADH-quinone oxidoreductase subunit N [Nibricoccus aquaticus]ATC64912.1 NADH-quinone oxidoreductase subunit N [Nibricoccus aquaticus]